MPSVQTSLKDKAKPTGWSTKQAYRDTAIPNMARIR
jgi:hypothetical protein